MDTYLTQYQSANRTDEASIKNFIVRKKELERVIADIRTTEKDSSFQHYVFVGRRGSGKSTLLRRVQAEVSTDVELSKRFIVVNLSEEQAGVYKLYDLWDYVIRDLKSKGHQIESPDWQEYATDMKAYTHKLYQIISHCLAELDQQLILLIDNIDRIFKNIGGDAALLREQLMNYNDVRIVSGSTIMSENYWRYDLPFYQFFSIKRLKALSLEEIKALLKHWSAEKKLPEIANFIEKYPGKIQAVRMLTDGTPRTMLLFVDMLINRPLQNGFDYLQKIIDQATPIYQERLGSLSSQQQKILVELSFFWEAAGVEQLVSVCKMPGKTISAQLNSLIKGRLVEKIKGPTKNNYYRLEERFFNLWLLMTQGGPKQKQDAKYLTIFLENWYDGKELKSLYHDFIGTLTVGTTNPGYVTSMTKALAHSKHLTIMERDKMLSTVQNLNLPEDLKLHLPLQSINIYIRTEELINEGKLQDAWELVRSIDQEDGTKHALQGYILDELQEESQAEKYYLLAIQEGEVSSLNNLANLYLDQGDFNKAEQYYFKAIDQGENRALHNLGFLYEEQTKLDQAEEYYIKAINTGSTNSLLNLAILYESKNEDQLAEKKYLEAINQGIIEAYNNLALLYSRNEKVDKARNCLLKAVHGGDVLAHVNLAGSYYSENKNKSQAVKLLDYVNDSNIELPLESLVIRNVVYLWSGELSHHMEDRDIIIEKMIESFPEKIQTYLIHLLILGQKRYVLGLFENPNFQDKLIAIDFPLYYTTINLNNPGDPRLVKVPPEAEENVKDILEYIRAKQEFYFEPIS